VDEPRLLGYIRKRAVAPVVIKPILAVIGDEDVFESIVVVVTDADAIRPSGVKQAGFGGNVGEGAIAILVVKTVARFCGSAL